MVKFNVSEPLSKAFIAYRRNLPSPLNSKALAVAQLLQSLAPISAQQFRGEPDSTKKRWTAEIRTLGLTRLLDDQLPDGLSESDSVGLGDAPSKGTGSVSRFVDFLDADIE